MTKTRAKGKPAAHTPAAGPGWYKKSAIFAVLVSLAAIFVTSFIYRLENPSMKVERKVDPGRAMMNREKPELSEKEMAEVKALMMRMKENPQDAAALMALAERFMRIGSYEQAASFLTRAQVVEPANVDVMGLLGECMFRVGKYEDSAGYFEQILAANATHAGARYNLGVLYEGFLHKHDLAKEYFQGVIDQEDAPPDLKEKAKKALSRQEK